MRMVICHLVQRQCRCNQEIAVTACPGNTRCLTNKMEPFMLSLKAPMITNLLTRQIHVNELDIEEECRVRRDNVTAALLTVGHVGRALHLCLLTLF